MYAGLFSLCFFVALEIHHATSRQRRTSMAPENLRNGLVFGVDLRVGFMIIYRHALIKSPRTKRRHIHGHKNEFHLEGIRCKAFGRSEGAQGREHKRCEHPRNSQGRSVARCVSCRVEISGPLCANANPSNPGPKNCYT